MKKIIQVFLVALLFAACSCNSKSNLDTNKQVMPLTDSSMVYNNSILTDTGSMVATDPAYNAISKSSGTIPPVAPHKIGNSTATGNNSTARNYSSSAPSKPRGWSNAAKDAAIGGVGGAIVGGVIGKGKGAIIGGVIGAGGGYVIGRAKDKRTGRVAQGRRYRRYRRSY